MNPRFILITTAAILLAGCDRRTAEVDAANAAEIAQQRQAEQAANDKIRQLEDRLNAAEQQKAADREAELARVKEELAQVKRDREIAAERVRDLQSEASKPAPPPVAQAPEPAPVREREIADPRGSAIHADLERSVEEEEDRQPVYAGRVVPQSQHVASVQAFYQPLDPYGDWIETEDYGYVFRPEIATRQDWRPYTDGHWVHSGHGWTWQSNEDFGWATYHYGRWTRIKKAGWVWVPGREWGPGWVSWRRGNEHCGWAPLPPESSTHVSFTASVDRDYDIGPAAYVFVALSNFGARSYAPVIERPEQNVTIINKTVNVTNITYNNTTNNPVVYNGGPSYDLIRARSRQPVENVSVNFAPQNTAINNTKIVNVRQGDTLQVAAPPLAAAAIAAAPLRVKEKIATGKADKGWEGVDPAQAQQVKQAIAATSTVRPQRPQPAIGAVLPATPRPAVPGAGVPSVVPARPERPIVAAPSPVVPAPVVVPAKSVAVEPARPQPAPNAFPKIEKPQTPVVVDAGEKSMRPEPQLPVTKPALETLPKPEAPAKPVAVEPARPRPALETLPKPEMPAKPAAVGPVEKPKLPEPEPAKPAPAPPASPKTAKPAQPVVSKPAPVKPVVPETRPKPPVVRPADVPARPRVEPPAKVNRPTPEPAAPRVPKIERSPVVNAAATPPPAPVVKRVIPAAPPAPQKIPPPPRPSQEVRTPQPPANRPIPSSAPTAAEAAARAAKIHEQTLRQENPVVQRAPQPVVQRPPQPVVQRPPQPVVQQRPPQPVAQPPPARSQTSAEEQDKKKKKKEGEQ